VNETGPAAALGAAALGAAALAAGALAAGALAAADGAVVAPELEQAWSTMLTTIVALANRRTVTPFIDLRLLRAFRPRGRRKRRHSALSPSRGRV
jgi:hypothetical protein